MALLAMRRTGTAVDRHSMVAPRRVALRQQPVTELRQVELAVLRLCNPREQAVTADAVQAHGPRSVRREEGVVDTVGEHTQAVQPE